MILIKSSKMLGIASAGDYLLWAIKGEFYRFHQRISQTRYEARGNRTFIAVVLSLPDIECCQKIFKKSRGL